jgi:hypothetical protein
MSYLRRLPWADDMLVRTGGAGWRRDSATYWEDRYAGGGSSGSGSSGRLAEFKAEIINGFVSDNAIESVIEFGCGDGNQLRLAKYPQYLGFDVSASCVSACRNLYRADTTKRFELVNNYQGETAELALSLDVIYHLVEHNVFEEHMRQLFSAAERYVCVYSSNSDNAGPLFAKHIRHRRFADWVSVNQTDWTLLEHIPNRYPYSGDQHQGSWSDFYLYGKR